MGEGRKEEILGLRYSPKYRSNKPADGKVGRVLRPHPRPRPHVGGGRVERPDTLRTVSNPPGLPRQ